MDNGRGGAWRRSVVGGKGAAYSAPGIAASTSVGGTAHTGADIAVEGPSHSLRDYWNIAGVPTKGKGIIYSAPTIAATSDAGNSGEPGLEITAQGPEPAQLRSSADLVGAVQAGAADDVACDGGNGLVKGEAIR
jgi:hypothetical protein